MALQPGVGLVLLYNTPPSLSVPCSVSPFIYSHLPQIRGHVIQPSHFWSSSSSSCIQLSVHLFWDCSVLHSFYMTKPSYSLAFNKPDNVLPLNYGFLFIVLWNSPNSFSFTGPYIFRKIFLSNTANALSSSMVSVHDSEPLVATGRTNVRYICNLLFLDMRFLLTNCLFA